MENEKIVTFEAHFGRVGATYAVHLRLIGKLVGNFLLVIIELFSLGAFVLSQYTRLTDKRTDRRTDAHHSTSLHSCCTVINHHKTESEAPADTKSTALLKYVYPRWPGLT